MRLNLNQKQLLADFLNNLSIVLITLGVIQPFFDQTTTLNYLFFIRLTAGIILGMIILLVGFSVLKK
jgi:hypothetical protein